MPNEKPSSMISSQTRQNAKNHGPEVAQRKDDRRFAPLPMISPITMRQACSSLAAAAAMAKDPICGMVVPTATALSAHRGERTYYFCSEGCRQTFLAPEQQMRRMRRRVGIALSGVLALAVLRAAVT